MAMFGKRSRCPGSGPGRYGAARPAGRSVSMRAARLFGIGFGLALALGSAGADGASAAASETGEAEAAPAPLATEQPPGRLIVATPDPVNPARIVAHTAQLPKSTAKPLFPVELPKTPTGRAVAPRPAAAASSEAAPSKPAATAKAESSAAKAAGPARRVHLPLAPSAAEIRREIAARNGGPLPSEVGKGGAAKAGEPGSALGAGPRDKPSLGTRLQERATTTPTQNPRWPTHVDYSAGPTGPAGGNTSGDRKGALIEATGPQQGVIRNRW